MLIVPYRLLSSLSPLCTCSTYCLNITPTCPFFFFLIWMTVHGQCWRVRLYSARPICSFEGKWRTLDLGYCVSCVTLDCSFFLLQKGRKKILIETQLICSVLLDSFSQNSRLSLACFFTQTVLQCCYKEPPFLISPLTVRPCQWCSVLFKKNSFDFGKSVIFWQVT